MGESTGINDDAIMVLSGGLNPVHQLTFMVALFAIDFYTKIRCCFAAQILNIRQSGGAINLWLARAEHVEIGAIENCDMHIFSDNEIGIRTQVAMQLVINGESQQLEAVGTVAQLVEKLALDMRKIAIERNAEIVPRSTYQETVLCDGDQIEIVQFIGGG